MRYFYMPAGEMGLGECSDTFQSVGS